jgi:hypothetical protein
MNDTKEFCEMSTLIWFMNVDCSFIFSVVHLFCMKLSIQTIIQFEMRLLRKLWISLSFDTWSYASMTFRFSRIVILFLLIFHTVWIYFVKSFNVVSHALLRRSLICVSKSSLCVSAKLLIRLTMIDFNVLSKMLKSAIDLYVLRFV